MLSFSPLFIRDPTTEGSCDSCHSKRIQQRDTHAKPLPLDLTSDSYDPSTDVGLTFGEAELHTLDFVYLDTQTKGLAWEIVQIVKISPIVREMPVKEVHVRVRIWRRVVKDGVCWSCPARDSADRCIFPFLASDHADYRNPGHHIGQGCEEVPDRTFHHRLYRD